MPRTTFRLTDACRAVGVALGAALLWAYFVGWLTERHPDQEDAIQVALDGTAYLQRITRRGDTSSLAYFQLVGTSLEPAKPPARLKSFEGAFAPTRTPLVTPPALIWFSRIARMIEPESGDIWHFVMDREPDLHEPGRGYFVLFDRRTRRPAQYIGREGGQSQRPAANQMFVLGHSWFNGSYELIGAAGYSIDWGGGSTLPLRLLFEDPDHRPPQRLTIVADDRLVEVDLKSGVVRPLPGTSDLVDAAWITETRPNARDTRRNTTKVLYWRTSTSLFRLDPDTRAQRTWPIPEAMKGSWISLHVVSENDLALMIVEGKYGNGRQDVARLSADGTLTDRVDGVIPVPPRSVYSPGVESLRMSAMTPSVAFVMSVDWLRSTVLFGTPNNAAAGVIRMTALATALLGLVAAALGEFWTRRFGQTAHPLWWIFLFLFGFPGLIGYRLHRRWPVRKAIALPASNGLEVFSK